MPLHIKTPLIENVQISHQSKLPVYLKLENCQPSGSFKLRGIGKLCELACRQGNRHVVTSSGGNAGLAAAYAAHRLGIKCTVIVPTNTPEFLAARFKPYVTTEVIKHGTVWDESDDKAREYARDNGLFYLTPFNSPVIWSGHATLVEELTEQLPEKPRCIVLSVGGGGLLCGIAEGIQNCGWGDVPILCMETYGADCFNQTLKAGKLVTLPAITSFCRTLGALTPCQQALDVSKKINIISLLVEDKQVAIACRKFADDQLMLVEPSCGASLTAIYDGIVGRLVEEGKLASTGPVVVIVCGGTGENLEMFEQWKTDFALTS